MRRRAHCWLCVALALATGAAQARVEPLAPEPAYGETLFAHYQRQYFDAISRLLVARERRELTRQAAEGELLLGGLYVQYGMPDHARAQFDAQLEAANPALAGRAWLALAELYYRRTQYAEALAVVEQRLDAQQPSVEAATLAVKALMRLGRHAEAQAWLSRIGGDLPEQRYLRFNVAMALAGSGDDVGAAQILQPLLALPAADDEMRALRDRVALALAALALRHDSPGDALAALKSARVVGPYSGEALLIYGIAALDAGHAKDAVRVLRPLAGRAPHDQAVQEGWLVLARAWEATGDRRKAEAAYRDARTLLDAELKYLDRQSAAIDAGEWFTALSSAASDLALRDERALVDDAEVLGLPLHYRSFADNAFVLAFAQYVEVTRLARLAQDWQARTPVLAWMVEDRMARSERLAREARDLLEATATAPYAQRQQELAARVDTALASADPWSVASPDRATQHQQLAAVSSRIARWPGLDLSRQQQRAALLDGVLAWEAARERPAVAWSLQRAVRDNARELENTEGLRTRVAAASRRQFAPVDGWLAQIGSDDDTLRRLAAQSGGLRDALRKRLEDGARLTIAMQRARIVQLAAEAYFGSADLQFGAWREQRDARRAAQGAEAEAR